VQPLAALVLAGGRSRRMGQDKALLQVDGQPLIARVCQVALACTPAVYSLTPWPERYRPLVPAAVQFLPEPLPAAGAIPSGPLVGLARSLGQVQAAWVLVLACDLPRLAAAPLQHWAAQLPDLPATTLAYVPRQGDRWEPLCGFYRSASQPALAQFVEAGERSLQRWLSSHPVAPIPAAPAELFYNLNTPADLAALPLPQGSVDL
jgi:molybdenum cofactor guanylyltransferase